MGNIRTCEFVSPKHPDKTCDRIADSILDAYLAGDPKSRVAVEVMGGHGKIKITGEVTSSAKVDIEKIARDVAERDYDVEIFIEKQSPEIAQGVDNGGAGDQGIMIGYATSETDTLMPKAYELARNLCKSIYKEYPYDGKTQVTINGDKAVSVVASFQNSKTKDLEELVKSIIESDEYFINPAGEWKIGGFEADSGLSGRKIVVDAYGPDINVGGGSFSGKDPTKVDRSAAYMARKISVDLLKKRGAREIKTKLAYAIGKPETLMQSAFIDGVEERIEGYDLTPRGIIKFLKLDRPIYAETSEWGHFGNGFNWG